MCRRRRKVSSLRPRRRTRRIGNDKGVLEATTNVIIVALLANDVRDTSVNRMGKRILES